MKRLIRQAQSYNVQFFDDGMVSPGEQNQGQMLFRIRVTGTPCNPDMIIPEIMPKVQQYIKSKYPSYDIDNISYENFNPESAQRSQKFPDTVDFNFTANFL